MNTHLLVHIFNLSFIAKLPCKFEKHFLFTAPSRRPIPNKFSLLLPHPGTNWTQFSPRSSAHRRREEKTGDVCRNTSVSRALYRRLFVYLLCRYEGRETRSNQMHFTIEFQAGEEESDSHLRGKREKKIWERETRGAWRSAATVSVCLMLIERCGSSCTPQLFRLRYYGFCASNISRLFFISRKNCQLHLTFCAFKWKIWTNENL